MPHLPTLPQRLAARTPPPGAQPVMFQRWEQLLFLHWEFPCELLEQQLPPGLSLDTHEGKAYLGIVPFFMSDIRPRFLPAVPWLSAFQELNLRTYVFDREGHPGVWFFTLDAANPVAVTIARRLFHLPYRHARMSATRGTEIDYHSQARGGDAQHYLYPAISDGLEAKPGSLEFFLLERYHLFAHDAKRDRLYRGQVAHTPYRYEVRPARRHTTGLIAECGLPVPGGPPDHQAVAAGFPIHIYPLQRLR